uniref:EGF-like domain-containing protein n=1 Tax=Mycobacterium phage Farewell TaxID=3158893 RepID=A0AAU8GP11_9CAUD
MRCNTECVDAVWNAQHQCILQPEHTDDHECLCGHHWPQSTNCDCPE